MKKTLIVLTFAFAGLVTAQDNPDYCASTLQPAIDALPATGGAVYVEPGTHECLTPLTIVDKSITLAGEGSQVSVLKWIAASNGIVFRSTEAERLVVRDIGLITSSEASGSRTAISARWDLYRANTFPSAVLENIEILGVGTNTAADFGYWNTGIRLTDAWHAKIKNVHIRGKRHTRRMGTGIHLVGYTIAAQIEGVMGYFLSTGIYGYGKTEGVMVSDSNFVYVTNGIILYGRSDLPYGAFIYGNHISAFRIGIYAHNRPQGDYAGNLIYKRTDSDAWFVGIILTGTMDGSRVRNNFVSGHDKSKSNGIAIQGSYSSITLNQVVNASSCVWLQSGSSHNRAMGNDGWGLNWPGVLDHGTNNRVHDNWP